MNFTNSIKYEDFEKGVVIARDKVPKQSPKRSRDCFAEFTRNTFDILSAGSVNVLAMTTPFSMSSYLIELVKFTKY